MRRQKLFRTSTLKFRQSFRELTQTFLILVTHMQTLPNGMKRQKILQEDLLKTLQNMRATRQEKLLFQLVRSYKNSFFVIKEIIFSREYDDCRYKKCEKEIAEVLYFSDFFV